MSRTLNLSVPAPSSGERLDRFLAAAQKDLSRNRLQLLIRDGCVQVNGRPGRASQRLHTGDQRLECEGQHVAQREHHYRGHDSGRSPPGGRGGGAPDHPPQGRVGHAEGGEPRERDQICPHADHQIHQPNPRAGHPGRSPTGFARQIRPSWSAVMMPEGDALITL